MLMEEYVDETTGTTRKRFKPVVIVAEADGRGRLHFEKGQENLVKSILRDLRKIDTSVKLDESGLMLPEEDEEKPQSVNKGGRPRKEA